MPQPGDGPGDWYSCGRCIHGELGRKVVTEGVDAPGLQNADVHRLALPAGAGDAEPPRLQSVTCGHYHCLAIATDGQAFAWGANGEGQLGLTGELADDVFVGAPARALGSAQDQLRGDTISTCAGGRSHSVFVSAPGGRCLAAGRLPVGEPGRRGGASVEEVRELGLVDGAGGRPQGRVVSCSAGESHTLFVTSEGEVWSWLDDAAVRTTLSGLERPTARAVLGLPKVARVACGWHHTLALTEDRRVYTFGVGCFGQLGLGACRHCPSPSQVALPAQCDKAVVDVAAGFASSFAVTTQGWVYAWGANEKCQLGLGDSMEGSATPKPIDALSRVKVVQVSAGFSHTACVTSDGLVYLWGYGAYGQLGFAFNDVRSSALLGAQAGVAPLSSCGSGVGAPPQASAGEAVGASLVGHSRPWVQVWPRRCVSGPFAARRCTEVQCGAYHTILQASSELLGPPALVEPEVLLPAPLELSDMPAAASVTAGKEEDPAGMVLPPGAGLVESPKTVLRQGAGLAARSAEAFRLLAGLFWDTGPPVKRPAPAPTPGPAAPTAWTAEEGEWRRALALAPRPPGPGGGAGCGAHPLEKLPQEEEGSCVMRVDSTALTGPAVWDEVDEAVHRAFCDGSAADTSVKLDLAVLVQNIGSIASPDLPDGELNRGLPPAPCRGLARIQRLTPRPFYLPVDESKKATGVVVGKPDSDWHAVASEAVAAVASEAASASEAVAEAWRAARAETAAAADDGPQAQADGQPAPTPDGAEAVPVRGDLAELPSPVPSPAPTPRPARAGAAGEARAASPGLPSPRQARRSNPFEAEGEPAGRPVRAPVPASNPFGAEEEAPAPEEVLDDDDSRWELHHQALEIGAAAAAGARTEANPFEDPPPRPPAEAAGPPGAPPEAAASRPAAGPNPFEEG